MGDKLTNLVLGLVIVALVVVAVGLGLRMRSLPAEAAGAPERAATEPAALQITTSPAEAEVWVAGREIGRTAVTGHRRYRSAPLEVGDLQPGRYQVEVRRLGVESFVREVALQAGEIRHLHLISWHPEVVVRMRDGETLRGMIVGRDGQTVALATSPTVVVRLDAGEIDSQRPTLVPKMGTEVAPVTSADGSAPEYVIEPFPENGPKKR